MKQVPTFSATVQRMIREVSADIASGKVPFNISSFSELNDYVDANEYGGFCEDQLADDFIEAFGGRDEHEGMPDGFLAFMNAAQMEVDKWLHSRQQ